MAHEPSEPVGRFFPDLNLTPNTPWQRWHAAAVIAETFGASTTTFTLLDALDLTDVTRCQPDIGEMR